MWRQGLLKKRQAILVYTDSGFLDTLAVKVAKIQEVHGGPVVDEVFRDMSNQVAQL